MGKMFKALEKAERERGLEPGQVAVRQETIERELDHPSIEEILKETSSPAANNLDQQLVSYSQPGSVGAEQFRKLRTRLLDINLPHSPRVIMVTSARDAEGKSLIASNLATIISHDLHAHSLLVDADLRNPSLSRLFGLQNGHGLSNYLSEEVSISDLLMKTKVDKLTILSGGSVQDNPVELVGSKKMEALVNELKLRYSDRYVIIDSSPILATTEPSVLTRIVDGIILVIRAGLTPRETVKHALSYVDKKKVLGVVLNDLEFESEALTARYFGSSDYYYRYHSKKPEIKQKYWQKFVPFFRKNN